MNDNCGLPTKFVFHPVHTSNYCMFDLNDVSQDGYVAIYEYNMRIKSVVGTKNQNYWTVERITKLLDCGEWEIDIVIEDAPKAPEVEDLL